MEDVHEKVARQFSPTAANYATSKGHGNAPELARLVGLLTLSKEDDALDVATGAGHTAFALAPFVKRVIAYDLTPAMLDQVVAGAATRGLTNIEVVEGLAESLPFEDGAFRAVTNRFAAHHFGDLWSALQETVRVLKPGGQFLLVDVVSPEPDEFDVPFNEIETLRDPSHVRNYKASEWRTMVESLGMEIEHFDVGWYADQVEFAEWTRRIGTPTENLEPLREMLMGSDAGLREALRIDLTDGIHFWLPELRLVARKPA